MCSHFQIARDKSDVILFIERFPHFVDWMFAIGVKLFKPSQTFVPSPPPPPPEGAAGVVAATGGAVGTPSAYNGLHPYFALDPVLIESFLSVRCWAVFLF